MHSPPRTPVSSRIGVFSWALWDWGSASFNAVIITFVFTPYLTKAVASSEESGSAALGWSMAAAGLVILHVGNHHTDNNNRHKPAEFPCWLVMNTTQAKKEECKGGKGAWGRHYVGREVVSVTV